MVSFPLSLFLIPYTIIIAVIAFLSFISLRNLARYRAENVISSAAALIFLCGLAVIAFFSYQYLSLVNWAEITSIGLIKTTF